MWSGTGVRFGRGGDLYAAWAEGAAAGSTGAGGNMRVDPQFMGTQLSPFLWAHEIGHALGLDHNSFGGLMTNPVNVGSYPVASEKSTVVRLHRGSVEMGPEPRGGVGAASGGGGGSGGGGAGGAITGGSGTNIQQIQRNQTGGGAITVSQSTGTDGGRDVKVDVDVGAMASGSYGRGTFGGDMHRAIVEQTNTLNDAMSKVRSVLENLEVNIGNPEAVARMLQGYNGSPTARRQLEDALGNFFDSANGRGG